MKISKIPKKKQHHSNERKSTGKKLILTEAGGTIRQRQNIRVLNQPSTSTATPHCSHGPCLLFADSAGNKWFGCAIFRSQKLCGFRLQFDGDAIVNQNCQQAQIKSGLPIEQYGIVRRNFEQLIKHKVEFFWCKNCLDYVQLPHKHPAQDSVAIKSWLKPIELIDPIQEDDGEAQYWFSEESIVVLEKALQKGNFDSVLCLGTPSLFENFKQKGKNVFLLDYDDRLARFYCASEFARFSMLTCHFYLAESQIFLLNFFGRAKNLVCACDPPFGVQISSLMRTITTLHEMFEKHQHHSPLTFNTVLFGPYFIGKHLTEYESFSMVDFKVTYKNHRDYSKSSKSIVRMFTDLPNCSFKLPANLGYKFCEECNRFVARENQHCWKCGECTSKDGTPFVHCDRCARCVRKKYSHCRSCGFCHLRGRCQQKQMN